MAIRGLHAEAAEIGKDAVEPHALALEPWRLGVVCRREVGIDGVKHEPIALKEPRQRARKIV